MPVKPMPLRSSADIKKPIVKQASIDIDGTTSYGGATVDIAEKHKLKSSFVRAFKWRQSSKHSNSRSR